MSTPTPRVSYLIRSKTGTELRVGPKGQYNENLQVNRIVESVDDFKSSAKAAYSYSADGSRFAVTDNETKVVVFDASTNQPVCELNRKCATVALSPLGTYLLTWEKYDKAANSNNMIIWNVSSGKEVGGFIERVWSKQTWPPLRWTVDESVCAKMVTNQVQLFQGCPFDQSKDSIKKIHYPGIGGFALGPMNDAKEIEVGGHSFKIAVFVPEKKGKAANVSVFSYPDGLDKPCASKGFFNAQEAKLKWSPSGKALLIRTHTEQGSGKDSYYGATGLHLLQADGSGDCVLPAPAHMAAWCPNPTSDEFIAITGRTPPNVTLRSRTGNVIKDFGNKPVNVISWSNHGKYFCLCGFNGMQGKMFFYQRSGKDSADLLGESQATTAAVWGWSPDSESFMTACTFPRMKVGNCVEIFSCNGQMVYREEVEELYESLWRPSFTPEKLAKVRKLASLKIARGKEAPKNLKCITYPMRQGPPPRRSRAVDKSVRTMRKTVKASKGVYRAPGSSGGLAAMMRKARGLSAAPEAPSISAGKKSNRNSRNSYQVIGAAPPIPGMPTAKQSGKKKKRSRGKKKAESNVAQTATEAPKELNAEMDEKAVAKAVKKLRKKLKQILLVKEKFEKGEELNEDQKKKLDGEKDVRKELAEMEALQK
eukprot:g2181.t1